MSNPQGSMTKPEVYRFVWYSASRRCLTRAGPHSMFGAMAFLRLCNIQYSNPRKNVAQRERERERERDSERQTGTETDRQTHKETERNRERMRKRES